MLSHQRLLVVLASAAVLCGSVAEAKAVFCHYLLGYLAPGSNHAQQDISDAQAAGFDAFALNTNSPSASYATEAFSQLFAAAESSNFKLFFSMDAGAGGWAFSDWDSVFSTYLDHPAYYRGPNGKPFISTFDAGTYSKSEWASFRSAHDIYFVPNFDDTSDYYTNYNSWHSTWDSIVDGLFSWETAWPGGDATQPANASTLLDQYVQEGASAHGKSYMISLSSLQYKHWPANNLHWYRIGEVNLPQRMEEILSLGQSSDPGTIAPDFAEVITWNDSGESHYIGNIWDDDQASWEHAYADSNTWTHAAWQPLVNSFIAAFKAGQTAAHMTPPGGSSTAVGATWYRTILKHAHCSSDPQGKPSGWEGAQDAVNWAIVLPSGHSGTVRTTSGGRVIGETAVTAGLNYMSVPGLETGSQTVELLDGSGNVVLTASGKMGVAAESNGVCNFNYQVAAFE